MVGSAIFSTSGAGLITGSIFCTGFMGVARASEAFGSGDSGRRRIAMAFSITDSFKKLQVAVSQFDKTKVGHSFSVCNPIFFKSQVSELVFCFGNMINT